MVRYASLLLCCLVGSAVPLPAHALDLDEYPELRGFIDEMVERHGFGRAALTDVFGIDAPHGAALDASLARLLAQ